MVKGCGDMNSNPNSFESFMHKTIAKTLLDRGIITLERYTVIIARIENNKTAG